MRPIRRRKFKDITRSLHVQIEVETYRKLEKLAGNRSLGWAVEKLVDRASAANTTTK